MLDIWFQQIWLEQWVHGLFLFRWLTRCSWMRPWKVGTCLNRCDESVILPCRMLYLAGRVIWGMTAVCFASRAVSQQRRGRWFDGHVLQRAPHSQPRINHYKIFSFLAIARISIPDNESQLVGNTVNTSWESCCVKKALSCVFTSSCVKATAACQRNVSGRRDVRMQMSVDSQSIVIQPISQPLGTHLAFCRASLR